MSPREAARRAEQRRRHFSSFTVDEWCEHRRVSRAMFYKLDEQGLAPKSHYAGSKRLISAEADAAWLRDRERDAA